MEAEGRSIPHSIPRPRKPMYRLENLDSSSIVSKLIRKTKQKIPNLEVIDKDRYEA